MIWGPEKMLIGCGGEGQRPAGWILGPPVGHWGSGRDTTLTAIGVGGQGVAVLFGVRLPLTREPWVNPFRTLTNKVRGKYICKEVFLPASVYHCVGKNITTLPHHPSLLVSLQDWILYQHRADVYKSLLVGQHWCINVQESIRERRLWVGLHFPSSAPDVFFVLHGWFVRW